MPEKSLLTKLAETIDQHRAERKAAFTHSWRTAAANLRTHDSRWWLPTPGNVLFTLIVIGSLLWAQSVGAISLGAPLTATTSTAGIPYQGRLADKNGAPLTQTVNMIFRLYAATGGGSPLWEEQWTGANSVQVSDGLFNVMLGSLTPIPQAVITGNNNLFLGITVGTDSEMSPRVQLGSVPFATQALTVPDGSITTAKLAADVSFVPPDGSVTQTKAPFAPILYNRSETATTDSKLDKPIIYTTWFHGSDEGYQVYNLSHIFTEIVAVNVTRARTSGGNDGQVTFMVTDELGINLPTPSSLKIAAYTREGNLAAWIQGYVIVIGR